MNVADETMRCWCTLAAKAPPPEGVCQTQAQ